MLVVSNVPGAQGLAARRGAPHSRRCVIDHKDFASREAFDAALDAALNEAGVELLCNAGFMRLHTEGFVGSWWNRHLNIHPSLLPAFKGLHTHARVLEEGVKITGCTVHFVRPEMDTGPIVAQAAVPVLPGDTADSLAARVLDRRAPPLPPCARPGRLRRGPGGRRACGRNDTDQTIKPPYFSPPLDEAL